MAYELKIETSFAAAHNLLNYCGQCEKLHGHNWKVEIKVRGEDLDESGMLLDFKILKNHTEAIIQSLDHCTLTSTQPLPEKAHPLSLSPATFLLNWKKNCQTGRFPFIKSPPGNQIGRQPPT